MIKEEGDRRGEGKSRGKEGERDWEVGGERKGESRILCRSMCQRILTTIENCRYQLYLPSYLPTSLFPPSLLGLCHSHVPSVTSYTMWPKTRSSSRVPLYLEISVDHPPSPPGESPRKPVCTSSSDSFSEYLMCVEWECVCVHVLTWQYVPIHTQVRQSRDVEENNNHVCWQCYWNWFTII